jgi:predicted lipoprotein with Yx(FWY)xxD motif
MVGGRSYGRLAYEGWPLYAFFRDSLVGDILCKKVFIGTFMVCEKRGNTSAWANFMAV